jgi:hypothetical protein
LISVGLFSHRLAVNYVSLPLGISGFGKTIRTPGLQDFPSSVQQASLGLVTEESAGFQELTVEAWKAHGLASELTHCRFHCLA